MTTHSPRCLKKSLNSYNYMDTVYIAIDPGSKGCVTMLDPDGRMEHHFIAYEDMKDILDSVRRVKKAYPLCRIVAVMEEVHAVFGSSAKGTFAFGEIFGFLKGMIFACGIPLNLVPPKEWQKEIWRPCDKIYKATDGIRKAIDTKATSITAARRIFPQHDLRRTTSCKNPDDNLCDSMLIAEYARRKNL